MEQAALDKEIYGDTGMPQTQMSDSDLNKEAYGDSGGPQSQAGGDGGATPQSQAGGEGYTPQSQQTPGTNPNAGRPEGDYGHEAGSRTG